MFTGHDTKNSSQPTRNPPPLRASDPGGCWREEVPFMLGRNANDRLRDCYPRHLRVTQPKSRSTNNNAGRTYNYQKVEFK